MRGRLFAVAVLGYPARSLYHQIVPPINPRMSCSPPTANVRHAIAGLDVYSLAEEFGTPTYVYVGEYISQRIADLATFDVIRYAQKACSNLAILDWVRRRGALVDCVSSGEIQRALRAGFQPGDHPPQIVYTADIFDAEALDLVVEHGIHVNCGSPDMIGQLGERLAGGEITLRINPGFGHGHSQKTNTGGPQSKHGIWHDELPECLHRAAQHGLQVTGLHMHIGSGTDLEHLSQVCSAMEQAAHTVGPSLRTISAGGGLPISYRPDETAIDLPAYCQLWQQTRDRLAAAWGHTPTLEIEPGRFIVAEAGYLLAEIRAIKEMGPNTYYLVDAGFNNLARPILYGAYHPIAIAPRPGSTVDRPQRDVVVGGPLCESGDIFTQQEGGYVCTRQLPQAEVGELLILECAGAYGHVMSSNYNSKPLAAEVLIGESGPQLIRQRQTFEDLVRGEIIPS